MDYSKVDFTSILTEVKNVATVVLPVVVSFVAFRKGFQFLKSCIKGA